MRKTLSATAILVGGMALLATSSARAAVTPVTLLQLVAPPAQIGQPYDLFFTAGGNTTAISIGGYQKPAFEYVSHIMVTLGGGANLLDGVWHFVPASAGSNAKTQDDGTSVPALWFGGISPGNYDAFSSDPFATTPGVTYLLSFNFTNPKATDSSALRVTTIGGSLARVPSSVPEPSTWAMMLLGFVGLGFLGYRRSRKIDSRIETA